MDDLLSAARFIDSDVPAIKVFANAVTAGVEDEKDKVLRLYHAIRDDIVYDPYVNFSDPSNFRASDVLASTVAASVSARRRCLLRLRAPSACRRGSVTPTCAIT